MFATLPIITCVSFSWRLASTFSQCADFAHQLYCHVRNLYSHAHSLYYSVLLRSVNCDASKVRFVCYFLLLLVFHSLNLHLVPLNVPNVRTNLANFSIWKGVFLLLSHCTTAIAWKVSSRARAKEGDDNRNKSFGIGLTHSLTRSSCQPGGSLK